MPKPSLPTTKQRGTSLGIFFKVEEELPSRPITQKPFFFKVLIVFVKLTTCTQGTKLMAPVETLATVSVKAT